MSKQRELTAEDQARVDKFVSQGINSVERKPFRPLRLLFILLCAVTVLSVFSLYLSSFVVQ